MIQIIGHIAGIVIELMVEYSMICAKPGNGLF